MKFYSKADNNNKKDSAALQAAIGYQYSYHVLFSGRMLLLGMPSFIVFPQKS